MAAVWAMSIATAFVSGAQADARVEGGSCRPYFGKLPFAASDQVVGAVASARARARATSSDELRFALSAWAEARRVSVGYLNGLRGAPDEPTELRALFDSATTDPNFLRQVYGNVLGPVITVVEEPRSRARREVNGVVDPAFLETLELAVQFHELTGRWLRDRSVPSNFTRAFLFSEGVFRNAGEDAVPGPFPPF